MPESIAARESAYDRIDQKTVPETTNVIAEPGCKKFRDAQLLEVSAHLGFNLVNQTHPLHGITQLRAEILDAGAFQSEELIEAELGPQGAWALHARDQLRKLRPR